MAAHITGIGVVSPYGIGRECFWKGVSGGQQALRDITRFDASSYRNTLGGEVPDFDAGGRERSIAFAVSAAQEAVADAGIDLAGKKVGLILGTNFGGVETAEGAFEKHYEGDSARDFTTYLPDAVIKAVREACPSAGPEAVLSLSCASGAAAVGTALEWLRSGRADVVLAGGFDELSQTAVAGLSALRAISKDTIRPWDVNRGGTIFSEGAAVLVLESEAVAAERNARTYARVLGRGINNDAFHMTAPEKTGKGIVAVMQMALQDAQVDPGSVAHLNCHGTGTKYNDMIETTAIKTVFGAHTADMIFTASKSLFGHTMGAAGAMEAAVTCLSVHHDLVPPTLGCQEQDPELDIELVKDKAREMSLPVAMTNSYGLGGTNASLVIGK